jgi:hypothetical protein
MRQITVGTAPTLLAPAGNRDYIAIFNNSSNVPLYVCFDGDDGGSQVSTTLTASFLNTASVTSLTVASATGIFVGALITGTGVPAGTYVTSVTVDAVHETITVGCSFTASGNSDGNAYTFGQAALTSSIGFPVPAGTNLILSNDSHRNLWNKAIYGITSSSTADVRIQGA